MPHKRGLALVLGLALCALLAACGGSGYREPGATEPPASPSEQSSPGASPAPMPAVVTEMLANVSAGRALSAPGYLATEVISREELPALLESTMTDDDRRWFAETTTLYRLLGYLGPDEDYETLYMQFAAEAVIGFYVSTTDRLYVVTEDGRGFDNLSDNERETLAHELMHALQDYHFDLEAAFKALADNRDQNLAYTAVVEGDATVHEVLADGRRGMLLGPGYAALADVSLAQEIPAAIERELRFPYTTGADWVASLKATGGTAAIDELLREPPLTTAVVLHPERGPRWQPDAVTLPDISPALGSDWSRESGGTFGEFHWMNLLQTRLRGLEASESAAEWTGDSYAVYVGNAGSAVAFSVRSGDGLVNSVSDWLSANGDASTNAGVLQAAFQDGRAARLSEVPGGFVLVIGSSDEVAAKVFNILEGG